MFCCTFRWLNHDCWSLMILQNGVYIRQFLSPTLHLDFALLLLFRESSCWIFYIVLQTAPHERQLIDRQEAIKRRILWVHVNLHYLHRILLCKPSLSSFFVLAVGLSEINQRLITLKTLLLSAVNFARRSGLTSLSWCCYLNVTVAGGDSVHCWRILLQLFPGRMLLYSHFCFSMLL